MQLSELKHNHLQQYNMAIWGYGIEGQAMAAYFAHELPELSFTVLCKPEEVDSSELNFVTETVTEALLNQFDLIIKSPGISPYQAPASLTQTPMVSTAAIWFANHKMCPVIAVTGTKGKSTSCSLLAYVLRSMGFEVALAGNIGEPLIQCTQNYDYVVLETSSYQAQDGLIAADIGVLLNLFPEHLNWHGDEATYYRDKLTLLSNSQSKLVNGADETIQSLLDDQQADIREFDVLQSYHVLKDVLMYQDKPLLSEHGWKLLGRHNLVNAAAVLAVIEMLGLDVRAAVNAMRSFEPLAHRLQTVAELNGVHYIDDSIASTPVATLAALAVVPNAKTVLLLGGYDRGIDWSDFAVSIHDEPPKMVLCSGQNGTMIADVLRSHEVETQIQHCVDLQSAVKLAQKNAEKGDCVLLSPGAPSYDAFDNYQARGLAFLQWIKQS